MQAVALVHRAALLRFIRARGGRDDAEDIFQDLWLKLKTTPPSGPVAEPLGYLYRAADNLMHDRRRATIRRERREAAWGDAETGLSPAAAPPVDRALAARQDLGEVAGLLAGLGERTDQIFRRFRLDGANQKVIAAEQGISLSAVEKHLQRAYRALMTWRANHDRDAGSAEMPGQRRLDGEDRS